ncbi:MAG: DEAD/DEAH box helicase [bacterium]|nr:DEAD/DEAH box helicase [bacterium]
MIERELLHVRHWREGSQTGCLALDLTGSDKIIELSDGETPPENMPDPIMVIAGDGSCSKLPNGALLVCESVLWSLLDPMEARPFAEKEAPSRLVAETQLRQLAVRFIHRIKWWQALKESARESCRRLVKGRRPDLNPLFDILDEMPTGIVDPLKSEEPFDMTDLDGFSMPSTAEDMHGFFMTEEGLGALYGENFKPRSEQAQMGRDVAGALDSNHALMVEAGTGVGKTLGYLVPLISTIDKRGTRAVISTHTKALQSQILDQDLPRLKPLLKDHRFNLLMGRSNYLCLRQRLAFFSKPVENLFEALQAASFRLWLQVTEQGLKDELADHPLLAPDLDSIFFKSDICLPGQCYEGSKCFVQRARRRARDSDLLVVNHSLLMHDFQAGHILLGEIDHLVVDEAHRLPVVALETHAIICGRWRLDEVADLLGRKKGRQSQRFDRLDLLSVRLGAIDKDGQKAASAVEDFSVAIRRVFAAFRSWWDAMGDRVDEVMPESHQRMGRARVRDKAEAFGELRPQTTVLLECLAESESVFGRVKRTSEILEDLSSGLEDDLAQLATAGQMLRKLHEDVRFLTTDEDEDWVTWVEPAPESGLRMLGSTLLEAGGVLKDYWDGAEFNPVMTSATLAVGEDFSHLMGELGLRGKHPATLTSTCPSPFDYPNQVKILTPKDFPAPNAADFGQAVGEVMRALGMNSKHKTMGLYTSYKMIRESVEVLSEAGLTFDERTTSGPVVLAQSPRTPSSSLLEKFRRHRRAMLLGTATFWEGVDFPGRDLEILVVTKLPFLVPNDPWVEARCERMTAAGENPFIKFMVRDAILRMRQGFGRLIRRVGDQGVVIILDNRLHKKNYGVTFLSALPTVPSSFGDADDLVRRVDEFFEQS